MLSPSVPSSSLWCSLIAVLTDRLLRRQRYPVVLAEPAEQERGPLDVGEQQRDHAGRQLPLAAREGPGHGRLGRPGGPGTSSRCRGRGGPGIVVVGGEAERLTQRFGELPAGGEAVLGLLSHAPGQDLIGFWRQAGARPKESDGGGADRCA